jgi:hypothetical protein
MKSGHEGVNIERIDKRTFEELKRAEEIHRPSHHMSRPGRRFAERETVKQADSMKKMFGVARYTLNDDIAQHIVQKNLTAVNGSACVTFRLPKVIRGKRVLIVLGMYPAARETDGYVSMTEHEMNNILDAKVLEHVAWIDVCMLSTDHVNADINQGVIESWSSDIDIVSDWIRRFTTQLQAGDPDDVSNVYVAGKIPQVCFETAKKLKLVKLVERHTPNVAEYEINGRRFICIEGHHHPSYHLMSH